MRAFYTIVLLLLSNTFMNLAWYGHLKFKDIKALAGLSLAGVVLVSWGIALLEYCFQVPANRLGYQAYGGPFSLLQLKVIQEVITLVVFLVFSGLVFRNEPLRLNQLVGLGLLVLAVYFIFKK